MKYLKKYEELLDEKVYPKVGYYVIMESANDDINIFLYNNIGQIINVYKDDKKRTLIQVKYNNVPKNLYSSFHSDEQMRIFGINQIKYMSKNKTDIELLLNSKKYNI